MEVHGSRVAEAWLGEHYLLSITLSSVWDECNCAVVSAFFELKEKHTLEQEYVVFLCNHGLQSTMLLCPWDFSRQEYWSGLPFPSLIYACMLSCFSHVQLYATLWTAAHQAPLSLGFSRQEHWSGYILSNESKECLEVVKTSPELLQ